MSLTNPNDLATYPAAMWDRATRDVEAELERAREFAVDRFNEIELAHEVLHQIDPDPEPGEPLPLRLCRVLNLHL